MTDEFPAAPLMIHLSENLGRLMIEAIGGEQDERGRWIFPDDSAFWVLSEAVTYALEAMPTVVFDAMSQA